MKILTLRTDKPEAEIGIFGGVTEVSYEHWEANRQLAETIHQKITDCLSAANLVLSDLEGIAVYKGPGSFTGLRIGLSVANALADSLKIPIIGEENGGWLAICLQRLIDGENDQMIIPEYGALPNITQQKK